MSQPWLKFYPADWRSDEKVRLCSLAARGLWMEMLCVMHGADPRGSLVVNGRALTLKQIATLAGTTPDDVEALLAELEECGVFSRDEDGTIYSRRIRRDVVKAETDRSNGKEGGNPSLKGGVNPQSNAPLKAQKPETRDHNPNNPSPPLPPANEKEGEDDCLRRVLRAYPEAEEFGRDRILAAIRPLSPEDRGKVAQASEIYALKHAKKPTTHPHNFARFVAERRFEGYLAQSGETPAESDGVYVRVDTDQWRAWDQHSRKKHGTGPPTDKYGKGWRFPSEWPPGFDTPKTRESSHA